MAPTTEERTEAVLNRRLLTGLWAFVAALLGLLSWLAIDKANSIAAAYEESKAFDQAQLLAISTLNAQVSALIANLEGGTRTQAAVDAGQDFRMGSLTLDIDDHEARLRFLEQWRVNVINRDDPPL